MLTMFYVKTRQVCHLLFLILGFFLISSSNDHLIPVKKRYRIEEGSKLYLKGTSNVNAFTCDCEDQYAEQTLDIERNGGYARFRNVDLLLKSKNFDCHNRKIDCDMQKALRADQYPYIKIALVDATQDPKCLDGACKDWFDVQAKVNITIANATKEQSIPAKAKVLGPGRFQIRGEKTLQMSAYGIHPPEAMFGLIKVNDSITFHFDLIVRLDEVFQ